MSKKRLLSKTFKRITVAVCVAALGLSAFVIPHTTQVQAASKTYKIEFRAGSHGNFQGTTRATANVEYNDSLTYVPEPTNMESGYWFTGYSPEVATTVTESAVYVAQYARLIDAVEYRINFVDTTGASLATQRIAYANNGESITAYAVDIAGYTVDAVTKSVVAERKGTQITFVYTLISSIAPSGTTAAGTGTGTDGTPTGGGAGAGAGVGAGTGTGTDGTGTDYTFDGETATIATEPVTDINGEIITDDQVPLANQTLVDGSLSEINDESVPLANNVLGNLPTAVYVVAAIALLGIIVLLLLLISRKKKKTQE